MDWSSLITPVLTVTGVLIGNYLLLRQNRPLVAAQTDKAAAEAGSSRATTRQTDVDTAADLIALQRSSFELKIATSEASQVAKDLTQAAVVASLTGRVDALLLLGAENKAGSEKLLLETIENKKLLTTAQATIQALKEQVDALIEQLKELGLKPGPEAVEAAADVKAAEGEGRANGGGTAAAIEK